mgnify:CR=1 FL=1
MPTTETKEDQSIRKGPITRIEADPSMSVEDFLAEARERFVWGRDADRVDREDAVDDNAFATGTIAGQWAPEPLRIRTDPLCPRPVLVWDHIVPSLRKVINDSRQSKPSIKASAGVGGQKETADFYQERIRQIEYESDADIAYDTSTEQQVRTGRAFTRITTEYIPGKFQQRLRIEPIEDQFSVVIDPSARKYDRSDADWYFVFEAISKQEHERRYGKESIVSRSDFSGQMNPYPGWISIGPYGQMVQIASYGRKHYRLRTLCKVKAPQSDVESVLWKDELTPDLEPYVIEEKPEQFAEFWIYVINGAEVLDATKWIDSDINIVPLWGRSYVEGGKRHNEALIRRAKDPQRVLNMTVSNIAELVGQLPKSPYLVPVGGIPANLESAWQNVPNAPLAYLLYAAFDAMGRPLPKPERIFGEPPIQALLELAARSIDAIKSAMGIFDASIGARSNETSGIAIERRRKESDIVNYDFSDNQSRTRKRIGEILVKLIPLIDKPGSEVPIRGENGKTEMVPIGQSYKHPKTGKEITHVLTDGDYGVAVSTGPSYASARQEERDALTTLISANPEVFKVLGDRWMALSDTANSEEDAERIKRWISMLTPGLIEDKKGEEQPIPPQVQQQLSQYQNDLKAALELLQTAHGEMQSKQGEREHEIALKTMDLDFQREKLKADTEVAMAKLGSSEAIAELREDLARIKSERALVAQQQRLEAQHEHAESQATQDREHAKELQGGQQEHQAGQAEADRQMSLEQSQAAQEQETAADEPQGAE